MRKTICTAAIIAAAVTGIAGNAMAEAWSFGVMSDTQWSTTNADGRAQNPGTVAVGIINQLNTQFIDKGVKFVVQVGDLDDKEANYSGLPSTPRLGISTRASAAQALYNAGIGFFPLRGNHEGSQTAAGEVQSYFPQTQGGAMTKTGGSTFSMGSNFSSPSTNLNGLSYSFDYNNARFMLLDQFTPTDGLASDGTAYNANNNAIAPQQNWINSSLAGKPANGHAFVFSHKQLFGQNHTDTLFGSASTNAAAQNAFISSLDTNDVGYLFTGHDHLHNRSIVTSPDGASKVNQIIAASDSYKFYTPQAPSVHGTDPAGTGYPNAGLISKNRETQISQELYSTGYYIVTVDGPRATVDFYSADPTPEIPGYADVDLATTPVLTFSKRETFGYSLNGKQFMMSQGQSYTSITDNVAAGAGFLGTSANIMGGTNGSTLTDSNGLPLTKQVYTGWTSITEGANPNFKSDILSLWGMHDVAATSTDTFALSISYDTSFDPSSFGDNFGLRTKDAAGNWVLVGNTFVGDRPWQAGDALGTYGYDSTTHTVWAVLNHNSDFVAAVPEPGAMAVAAIASLGLIRRRRAARAA